MVETKWVQVEMTQRLARLGCQLGVIGWAARRVELHAPRLAVRVDKAAEEGRTVHVHRTPRELARDHGEPVLLADPVLMAREAHGGKSADDEQERREESHRSRIGKAPDGLDSSIARSPPPQRGPRVL